MVLIILKKIVLLIQIVYRNVVYFFFRWKCVKSLNVNEKDVILFYLPYVESITGGILSIFFLLDKTIELRPDKVVLPVVATKLQRYFRTSWFKSPFFIYNLFDIHRKLETASRIVIHVPEYLCEDFFVKIRKYKFENITRNSIINILNQNVECMPSSEIFYQNKDLCGKLTMTLAFAVNQEKKYSFLDIPQLTMSAWSYGDVERYSDFDSKENICIVSPDDHPLKDEIIQKLIKYGIQCIEIRNMPFAVYRDLCNRSKWAVTFGEGYDGYAMGTLKDGGVGFAVDSPNFRPAYIDIDNLPPNIFTSYQDMCDHIIERIIYFEQNPMKRKDICSFFIQKARELNSPELVMNNLNNYYNTVGF